MWTVPERKRMSKKAPELPFPPAAMPIIPGGMVEACLMLGAVVTAWGLESIFFDACIAKQSQDSINDSAKWNVKPC
jgi:hypothetical protein